MVALPDGEHRRELSFLARGPEPNWANHAVGLQMIRRSVPAPAIHRDSRLPSATHE